MTFKEKKEFPPSDFGDLSKVGVSENASWQRVQENATCVDGYTSAVFSWETE